MTGIAGIAAIATRGIRIDRGHVERWAGTLTNVEGEQQLIWTNGSVALAASVTAGERGGISHFIGRELPLRVVANARLDALAVLRDALAGTGQHVPAGQNDAELIAHAYERWGVRCLDYLLGDFTFVLRDERENVVLAARDQFGARQLYYAVTEQGLVLSSSAGTVFSHPWVSRRLDDQAVVDFLVHDQVAHDATLFADIRRLRAGHMLLWDGTSLMTRRYWTLEPRSVFPARDGRDYPRMLFGLLRTAVADRMRGMPAGVLMSGGIDSTAIAAAACEEARAPASIRAYTAFSSSRMVDREREYAGLAAVRLGLESELHDTDAYLPLHCPAGSQLALPIPDSTTIGSSTIDLLARVGRHGRLALTGIGPDGLLLPDPFFDVLRRAGAGDWTRTLLATVRHVGIYGRRPPMLLRGRRAPGSIAAPAWLVKEIRDACYQPVSPWDSEPADHAGDRRLAHRVMAGGCAYMLESYAAAGEVSGVRVAHPFLDLRVIDFCLRLPPVPWCWDKHVLREAASPALPVAVTRRRKAPLRYSWLAVATRTAGTHALDIMRPLELTRRYYAPSDFSALKEPVLDDPYTHLRPVALDLFLRAWSGQAAVS